MIAIPTALKIVTAHLFIIKLSELSLIKRKTDIQHNNKILFIFIKYTFLLLVWEPNLFQNAIAIYFLLLSMSEIYLHLFLFK